MAIQPQLFQMNQRRRCDLIFNALKVILMQFDGVTIFTHRERAQRIFDRAEQIAGVEVTHITASCHVGTPVSGPLR